MILSKYSLAGLNLKNRVVMPPMSRYSCCSNGVPSKKLGEYYIKRAKENIGLIIIEGAAIDSTNSKSYINGLSFYSDKHIKAWKPIIKEIKSYGAKVIIQLYHSGRLTTKKVCGFHPIAPSSIKPKVQKSHLMNVRNHKGFHFQTNDEFIVPKKITVGEIKEVINKFVISKELALKAGFDGIEIHGAHGYLVHQFINKNSNKRKDKYGKNQYLFLEELLKSLEKIDKEDTITSLRISQHMIDEPYSRYSKRDMDFEKITPISEKFIDVFHCSEIKAGTAVFGHTKSLSEEIRSHTKSPIITSGGVSDFDHAKKLLLSKNSNLIGFGRPLISNPDLVNILSSKNNGKLIQYDHKIHSKLI